jgi:hypothetical protein
MILRAPEIEALDGGSAPMEPRDPRVVDGSPFPLDLKATSGPIEIPGLCGGGGGLLDSHGNTIASLWRRKHRKPKQRKLTIKDHRGMNGLPHGLICYSDTW